MKEQKKKGKEVRKEKIFAKIMKIIYFFCILDFMFRPMILLKLIFLNWDKNQSDLFFSINISVPLLQRFFFNWKKLLLKKIAVGKKSFDHICFVSISGFYIKSQ